MNLIIYQFRSLFQWMEVCKKWSFWTILLSFMLAGTSYANSQMQSFEWELVNPDSPRENTPFSVHIANVRISEYPLVGKAVVLQIEVTSNENEPDLKLDILLPEKIQVMEGELHWRGSLSANEVYQHNLVIMPQEAGFYQIDIGLLSPPTQAQSYIDGVRFFIQTDNDDVQIIRNHEYRVTEFHYRTLSSNKRGNGK